MFKDIRRRIEEVLSGNKKPEYASGKDYANKERDLILSQTIHRINDGNYMSLRPGNPYDDYGLASDVYLVYYMGYATATVEELTTLSKMFQQWKSAIESLQETQKVEGTNKRNRDKLLENLTDFLIAINRRVNSTEGKTTRE